MEISTAQKVGLVTTVTGAFISSFLMETGPEGPALSVVLGVVAMLFWSSIGPQSVAFLGRQWTKAINARVIKRYPWVADLMCFMGVMFCLLMIYKGTFGDESWLSAVAGACMLVMYSVVWGIARLPWVRTPAPAGDKEESSL